MKVKQAALLLISMLMISSVRGSDAVLEELLALQVDLNEGLVSEIADVNQPILREMFLQMANDTALMNQLRSEHIGQSDLEILTVAVAEGLLKK
jgi:hypothetical protein